MDNFNESEEEIINRLRVPVDSRRSGFTFALLRFGGFNVIRPDSL